MAIIFGEQPRGEEQEAPKLIIPESYDAPRSTRKEQDKAVEDEKREEEARRAEEESQIKMPRKKSEFGGGAFIIGQERKLADEKTIAEEKKKIENLYSSDSGAESPKLILPENYGEKKSAAQVEADKKLREATAERIKMYKEVKDKVANGETISLSRQERQFAIDKGIINTEKGKTPEAVVLKTKEEIQKEQQEAQQEEERQKEKIRQADEAKAREDKEWLEKVKEKAYQELRNIEKGIDNAKLVTAENRKGDRLYGYLDADGNGAGTEDNAVDSFLSRAGEAYWRLNDGASLNVEAQRVAVQIAEDNGRPIDIDREDYRVENIERKEKEALKSVENGVVLDEWDKLSPKQQEAYDKKNKEGEGIKSFAEELEQKREDLNKQGINLSKEAYYGMVASGVDFSGMKIKKRFGLFGKKQIAFKGAYPNKVQSFDLDQFDNEAQKFADAFIGAAKEQAEREINWDFDSNQMAFKADQRWAAANEIGRTITEYESQKLKKEREAMVETPKVEAPKAETPKVEEKSKLEIPETFGSKRTPEVIKEMEKIRKETEKKLDRIKENKKKIDALLKKKKTELLTAKEIAFLKSAQQELLAEKKAA